MTLIRKAEIADSKGLVGVAESAFEHEYKKHGGLSDQYFREIVNSQFCGVYVAELNKEIVGYALYIPIAMVETAELMQIGVKREFQGRRIGTACGREEASFGRVPQRSRR